MTGDRILLDRLCQKVLRAPGTLPARRGLFGDQLHDPARRHEMETVLRAQRGWRELQGVGPEMSERPSG